MKVMLITLNGFMRDKVDNSEQRYIRYEARGDGDCGYTAAFGITRESALTLLQDYLTEVSGLLKESASEAILTIPEFIEQLRIERIIRRNITNEQVIANRDRYAVDRAVLNKYIEYDVGGGQIDSGWSHPRVLQALAHVQRIGLRIWRLGDQEELLPYQSPVYDYSHYVPPRGANRFVDLLLLNNNHFDCLSLSEHTEGELTHPIYPLNSLRSMKIKTNVFSKALIALGSPPLFSDTPVCKALALNIGNWSVSKFCKFCEALEKNTTLTKLTVKYERTEDDSIKAIALVLKRNTTLTKFSLIHDFYGIVDGSGSARVLAEALKENTTLTKLELNSYYIDRDGAQAFAKTLKENVTLTELALVCNGIVADGTKAITGALKENNTLLKLRLSSNQFNSKSTQIIAEALNENVRLTELALACNGIDDDGARVIAAALKVNTTLTKLNLMTNFIGIDGAKAIAAALKVNTTLTELDLSHNRICRNGIQAIAEALKENATLTMLGLDGNNIGAIGAKDIAGALKENTTLTKLGLQRCKLGDDGARAILGALKENTSLSMLNLDGNYLSVTGAKAIAGALKVNTTVTQLYLRYNRIGRDGAQAIAGALKENATLTKLDLRQNPLGAIGIQVILGALKENTTLTKLDMREKFYERNAQVMVGQAIARVLKVNSTLTKLCLSSNQIDSNGARAIAGALKENAVLTEFVLGRNDISDDGVGAIAGALKENITLTKLDLGDNFISTTGVKAMATVLEKNTTLTQLTVNRCFDDVSTPFKLDFLLEKNKRLKEQRLQEQISKAKHYYIYMLKYGFPTEIALCVFHKTIQASKPNIKHQALYAIEEQLELGRVALILDAVDTLYQTYAEQNEMAFKYSQEASYDCKILRILRYLSVKDITIDESHLFRKCLIIFPRNEQLHVVFAYASYLWEVPIPEIVAGFVAWKPQRAHYAKAEISKLYSSLHQEQTSSCSDGSRNTNRKRKRKRSDLPEMKHSYAMLEELPKIDLELSEAPLTQELYQQTAGQPHLS